MMASSGGSGGPDQGGSGRRRNERAHRAILRATVGLLAQQGYQSLTIEKVAARAGVGKATVYRWWPTKAALVLEAMREHIPPPPVPTTGDPRQDLRNAIKNSLATLTDSTTGVVLPALAADLIRDSAQAKELRALLAPRRESVLRIVRNATNQGLLPPDVDGPLLLDIYAGTIFYRLLVSREPITDVLIDQLADLLLDGSIPTTPGNS